jgi:hypothetical protein
VVYALGATNINYLRFETTHVCMPPAVSNISTNQVAVFCARINPTQRATILDRSFQMREWQHDAKSAIETYIRGVRAPTENRNTLIHGNVVDMAVSKARELAIINMGRDRRSTVFKSSLPAIRQVAASSSASVAKVERLGGTKPSKVRSAWFMYPWISTC